MVKKRCKDCVFSSINFWGYTECWKFDTQIDHETTAHTARREKDALQMNENLDCVHFEPTGLSAKILHILF